MGGIYSLNIDSFWSHIFKQLVALDSKIKPYFFLFFFYLCAKHALYISGINVLEFSFSTLSKKIQQSKFLISEPSLCLQAQKSIAFFSVLLNSLNVENSELFSLLVSIAITKF